jgi:hypothetical protein
MDVDDLSFNLGQSRIGEDDNTDRFGLRGTVDDLRKVDPALADKFDDVINTNAGNPLLQVLEDVEDKISEKSYNQDEDYDPNQDKDLIRYSDLDGPMNSLVDAVMRKLTLEEGVTVLEIGTENLIRGRTYLRMQYVPAEEDTWGIDDPTFIPKDDDDPDIIEAYDDDELIDDDEETITTKERDIIGGPPAPSAWDSDVIVALNRADVSLPEARAYLGPQPSERELEEYISYLRNRTTQQQDLKRIIEEYSHSSFDAVTLKPLRENLEKSLAFYVEFIALIGEERLPSFDTILYGLMVGDNKQQDVQVLHSFLSTLTTKLQSMV